MAEIVVMPKLGLLMETGTVNAWKVAEGEPVVVGQVIAEITTEKIVYELEAQAEGVLLKILVPEEGEVPVGAPIAIVGQPGEDIAAVLSSGGEALAAAASGASVEVSTAPLAAAAGGASGENIPPVAVVSSPSEAGPPAAPAGRVIATPAAKKLAADLGIDLAAVGGAGPSGRITLEDVQRAAAVVPPASAVGGGTSAGDWRGGALRTIPYAGMRRLIGDHMGQSRDIAPTVTYCGSADVERLSELLAEINAQRPPEEKINVTAAIIRAAALTLEKMPQFNSSVGEVEITLWRHINIGVAVALDDGLIVPVIREANGKSLEAIAREVKDLAARARENRLLPDEISGGTFTVSSLGSYRSVDFFNPILNQPETALLGVGRMVDAVVASAGQPVVHATMGLSLTCDHRVIDGGPAAEFLRVLMDLLAHPLDLLV